MSTVVSYKVKERDFTNAKAYLQTNAQNIDTNLYDHLARVLNKILTERPKNVVEIFENISRDVKRSKFIYDLDKLLEKPDVSAELELIKSQEHLFTKKDEDNEDVLSEQDDLPIPNMLEMAFYFEQAGVGLQKEEIFRLFLAIKTLAVDQPIQFVRFWGKVFGTRKNYFIVEAEYREGEEPEEEIIEEGAEPEIEKSQDELGNLMPEESRSGATVDSEFPEIPKLDFKAPVNIPVEEYGTGCNKKIYYVCNEIGGTWTRLPMVTPSHIAIARKIKKFFTGQLGTHIDSYPPFPGTEANYLRAQIARISASTQISPIGYYQFDEEEEDVASEDLDLRTTILENMDFEPIPANELIDIMNWVHHQIFILPQGRTTWFNTRYKDDEEEFEEEEEEEEMEPEIGPPLLTPLSEDAEVDGIPPWTAYLSSKLAPQYSVAVVKSNLWPGATAFCAGRTFENTYVGFGHKYYSRAYEPPQMPPCMEEYPHALDVMEADDPSKEDEEAYKIAQEEAEEEEEEEEEDEGDDDDDEEEEEESDG